MNLPSRSLTFWATRSMATSVCRFTRYSEMVVCAIAACESMCVVQTAVVRAVKGCAVRNRLADVSSCSRPKDDTCRHPHIVSA